MRKNNIKLLNQYLMFQRYSGFCKMAMRYPYIRHLLNTDKINFLK